MRIGIDIMGGDYSPKKTIQGAILAQKELLSSDKLYLFGEKNIILKHLELNNSHEKYFNIIDCKEIIQMGDHPIKSLKQKPKSSISIGFQFLSNGEIDGFASAGNTGALFVGGLYSVKSISGIIRPCLSSVLPKENGGEGILLDVGANADCKADVLYQFGILGSLLSKYVYGLKNPKVGLLNLGEEKTKGSLLTQATYEAMDGNHDYNFIGNIEGRDIFEETSDVIVCDGFTGNVVLKQAEAFYRIIKRRNLDNDKYFKRFNYENYGGTPILGLNKTVVIGHGISNEIAIKNMILLTKDIINAKLCEKIKETLN